jgi:hypothetical protein
LKVKAMKEKPKNGTIRQTRAVSLHYALSLLTLAFPILLSIAMICLMMLFTTMEFWHWVLAGSVVTVCSFAFAVWMLKLDAPYEDQFLVDKPETLKDIIEESVDDWEDEEKEKRHMQ